MSPSQRFVRYLILDEIEQIPHTCPICNPPSPEAMLGTQFFNCVRMRRFVQLLRQHRELIDLSSQGQTPSSSPAPLPSVP
jgi:hypothetical protein